MTYPIRALLAEFSKMLLKQEEMTTLVQEIKQSTVNERVEELSVKFQVLVDEYDQVNQKMYGECNGSDEDDDEEDQVRCDMI